ncbi:MAG: gamma-glutamylcyclotransferase [Pseudomonadota bacterium]
MSSGPRQVNAKSAPEQAAGQSGRAEASLDAPKPEGADRWAEDDLVWGERLADSEIFDADGGFWVFAYGSLMWDPGFPFVERRMAALPGYRRSFCLWSIHYRGTPARPGLVLALDRDPEAATRGVAYRVAPEAAAEARRYIAERELVSAAYFETTAWAEIACAETGRELGRRRALTYVVDRSHRQYAGDLSLDQQSAVIASSAGPKGPNWEYLHNTVAQLRSLGFAETDIDDLGALDAAVKARRGA